ncbi:alpha/beta hydrolase [Gordonia polyisoprenivorans]|uniref:alpha/beta hydrolase n=1 Tax=Gordonia polyisoprenivorans TaxID=84595 RepID=UPI0019FF8CB7|nr:alpha/beta hydrolase family protein [Gordonia polyisoprenivorans]MBE7193469.1 mycolyltransferase [Gordonia polyisoprenivorans]WCB38613.1 alpha/beta hydrolase family protein [Gordonia polyisoprenivorans]
MRGGGFGVRRRVVTALVVVTSTAGALIGVAGQARAVDPDTLRPGCEWRTPDEEAQHIQTCTLYSEALGQNVVVQVRASDQAPGQTEQAVYFLDGLGSNDEYNNWATPTSGAVAAYSTSYNLVMPAGGKGEWDTNWESAPTGSTTAPQWDTFLGEELPAYLNENFDIGTSDNAIVGVSMSGAPAVIVALNHPEVFAVARSYSGFYETNNPLGWVLIPIIQTARADIDNGLSAMWGLPLSEGNTWADNDVLSRIAEAKANGQTIIISTGNGIPSVGELQLAWQTLQQQPLVLWPILIPGALVTEVLGVGLEVGALTSTMILNAAAQRMDLPVEFTYSNGGHNWFFWASTQPSDAAQIEADLAAAAQKSAAGKSAAPRVIAPQVQQKAAADEVTTSQPTPTPAAAPAVETHPSEPTTTAAETPAAQPTTIEPTTTEPTTIEPTTPTEAPAAHPTTAADVAEGAAEATPSATSAPAATPVVAATTG